MQYRIDQTNTFEFPSVSALGAYVETFKHAHARILAEVGVGDLDFAGESLATSLRLADRGCVALVPQAEKLVDRIAAEIDFATMRREWVSDVAGAFVNVPDFLAGMPECMRKMQRQESALAPIRIFASVSTSAVVTPESIRARGSAILALTMALSAVRPVELFTYFVGNGNDNGDSCVKTKITTAPLVLSEACYALTSPGFYRNLNFAVGGAFCGYTGGWPKDVTIAGQRALVGAVEGDVIVPAARGADPIGKDPTGWVLARLAEIKAADAAAF